MSIGIRTTNNISKKVQSYHFRTWYFYQSVFILYSVTTECSEIKLVPGISQPSKFFHLICSWMNQVKVPALSLLGEDSIFGWPCMKRNSASAISFTNRGPPLASRTSQNWFGLILVSPLSILKTSIKSPRSRRCSSVISPSFSRLVSEFSFFSP